MSPLSIYPVSLVGRHVHLRAMELGDHEALADVGLDPEIWTHYTHGVRDAGGMRTWVEHAVGGDDVVFTTVSVEDGRVVGSTRYLGIDREHRRVEIGSTWLARPWRRTAINTEAKLLMLGHAFDALGCHRVELKTDARNDVSRAAIERLGARFEGIFRKHMLTETGRHRDSAFYAIVDDDWPEVRERLRTRLTRGS